MTTYNQNDVLLNMQQLIDRSRCGIDGFFTDSKSAAKDILHYLETENIIAGQPAAERRYNEQSQAA